jgi:oxygen-independent coproporphyrinogen-3 oxidase
MAGLPGETLSELKKDLKEIVQLSPDHISLYLLNIEKGTIFFDKQKKGELVPAGEDMQREFFLRASETLQEEGYLRYETSNYARPGFESRHNLKYWTGADYIGLGAGAHSYLSEVGWGLRWWNRSLPSSYCDDLEAGRLPLEGCEILGREEALSEAVLTSLRTREGLKKTALEERFGKSAFKTLIKRAEELVPEDLIIIEAGRIALTDKGALMADEIALTITR